ncbi:MAG: Imm40 family immunity protein [Chitinophagales bacterium]
MTKINKKLEKVIPNNLLDLARSLNHLGIDEVAWKWAEALRVVEFLGENEYLVLGGDVYKIVEGSLQITCDSWFTNRDNSHTWNEVVQESVEKAISYITNYQKMNGDSYCYSIVFSGK